MNQKINGFSLLVQRRKALRRESEMFHNQLDCVRTDGRQQTGSETNDITFDDEHSFSTEGKEYGSRVPN